MHINSHTIHINTHRDHIYQPGEVRIMKMKLVFASLLLVAIVLGSSLQTTMAASGFCDSKCSVRCSKAGVKDRCLKYCGICCEQCHCVPSGTYGHKDECPCYRDLKNSKGKPKCP